MIGRRRATIAVSRVPHGVLWLLAGLLGMALWLAPAPSYGQSQELLEAVERNSALSAQARYEEARPVAEYALRLAEIEFGTSDPTYAIVLNNLAENYRWQGFYDAAEPLYRRALTIIEADSGPDDPTTAAILNNLALLYAYQGRNAEAETVFLRALTIKRRALGEGHMEVALTLQNYAALLREMDRLDEAAQMEARIAAIRANPQEAPPKAAKKKRKTRRSFEDPDTLSVP